MDSIPSNWNFSTGSVVWGKLPSYKWWPGIIVNSTDIGLPNAKLGSLWVFWFGDYKVSQVSRKNIAPFTSRFSNLYSKNGGKCLQKATDEALELLATRFNHCHACPGDLLLWAEKGFKVSDNTLILNNDFPPLVINHLKRIQNLNKKLTDRDQDCSTSTSEVSEESIALTSNSKFRQVKEGSVKLKDVCIACFESDEGVVAQHPLFEGGLCLECKERLKETIFAFGDDGKNICCVICANPGSLILCDNINCPRSYCYDCIDLLLGREAQQQIIETTPWLCFFCIKKSNNEHSLLQIKIDWERRLYFLLQPSKAFVNEISILCQQTKKPIKVLSLFDGISTGKVALDSLGIAVDKYYASEIDEDAINVSKFHHSNSIIHIGDITDLDEPMIFLELGHCFLNISIY